MVWHESSGLCRVWLGVICFPSGSMLFPAISWGVPQNPKSPRKTPKMQKNASTLPPRYAPPQNLESRINAARGYICNWSIDGTIWATIQRINTWTIIDADNKSIKFPKRGEVAPLPTSLTGDRMRNSTLFRYLIFLSFLFVHLFISSSVRYQLITDNNASLYSTPIITSNSSSSLYSKLNLRSSFWSHADMLRGIWYNVQVEFNRHSSKTSSVGKYI